jgi:hypothetical protein
MATRCPRQQWSSRPRTATICCCRSLGSIIRLGDIDLEVINSRRLLHPRCSLVLASLSDVASKWYETSGPLERERATKVPRGNRCQGPRPSLRPQSTQPDFGLSTPLDDRWLCSDHSGSFLASHPTPYQPRNVPGRAPLATDESPHEVTQ